MNIPNSKFPYVMIPDIKITYESQFPEKNHDIPSIKREPDDSSKFKPSLNYSKKKHHLCMASHPPLFLGFFPYISRMEAHEGSL